MSRYDVIAFDADDTLWHNERLYAHAQSRYKQLLARYHNPEWIDERLYQTETRNLSHFGYGIKAFALSMIETAVELTEGRISGSEIQTIITLAKEMLTADVELLDHAAETLAGLKNAYTLMLITKGDLRDQELKIARSGVVGYFKHIEIVSDKSVESYAPLLRRHDITPQRFVMVGNSLRSDILPVLALGGSAVYVPHPLTWVHEAAETPLNQPGFYEIEHLGLLPGLLEGLENHGITNDPTSYSTAVSLRDVKEDDLQIFYEQQLDPEACRMAAFPSRERHAFMAHCGRIMTDESLIVRTILFEGQVAGNMVCFEQAGDREVGYWLGREYWGKGIATQALAQFLESVKMRPLYAHVAKHNLASRRVLEKCGFAIFGQDKGITVNGSDPVDEFILVLAS